MKTIYCVLLIAILLTNEVTAQKAGNAIQFDDIDDYIMVPHDESLNPGAESWTICMWIKAPDIAQRGPLVGKRYEGNDFNQYTIGIGNTDPHNPSPGKRIYANYIDTSGISERSGYLQDEFVDGGWHHIAFVADKNADSIFLFIDGQKWTTEISFNYGKWPDVGKQDPLYIGCNSYVSAFYEGQMDELSLWNKALSISQINSVMNDTLSTAYYSTTDSGLVAYYRFDAFEDLGIGNAGVDDMRDLSFYGNHGDAEGNPLLVPSGILVNVEEYQTQPQDFILHQNFPNPFNPTTKIKFTIPETPLSFGEGRGVRLVVYDILVNEVATLVNEELPAGEYELEFSANSDEGQSLSSGIYFYQLHAGDFIQTKKMLMIK